MNASNPLLTESDAGSAATLPASCGQERLWFLHQWEANRTAYNVPAAFDLSGPLDPEALRESCLEIVRRHEVLRTTFVFEDGEVWEVIHDEAVCPFEVVDLADFPEAARESRAGEIATAMVRQIFDLERGPLLRFILLRFGEQSHRLLVNAQHIVWDAWSFDIMLRELDVFYRSHLSGEPPNLDPLPIQYGDYGAWQRDWLKSEACAEQLAFWKEHLQELPETLALPTDRPASALQGTDGADICFELPPDLTATLEMFSRQQGSTLYLVLMAAYQALLYRCSGQERFLVGTPVANRSRADIEDLIGYFVNTVVLRADLTGQPTFRDLVKRVREDALNAFAHADLPFEKLIEQLHPERRSTRNPLFRTMMFMEEQPSTLPGFGGVTVKSRDLEAGVAKFDLLFRIISGGPTLRCWVSYSTELFDRGTIDRIIRHYLVLIRGLLTTPDRSIASLPLMDDQEQQQLLKWSRGAVTPYPSQQTIHAVFERRVAANPDALALVDGDSHLSYAELQEQANRWAHYLRRQAFGPGDAIGLFAHRDARFLAAILGILKIGASYVPLDPRDPPARLATLRGHLAGMIEENVDVSSESTEAPPLAGSPDGAAYVMFTSGSTGEPKGVVVSHQGVTRLVCAADYVQFDRETVLMQGSNLCFDASTFEIWGALLNGGTLVFVPTNTVLDHLALAEDIARRGINSLFLTTSLFNQHARQAPEIFAGMRCVVFGGEAADPAMVQRVLALGRPQLLVNGYGPTETTTFAVCHRIEEVKDSRVPIGRPIANTEAYLLDSGLRLVPAGLTGEIYIGGPGVALEYLHQPELTAERFVQTPYGRLYRTGDFGRWQADGTIEYQGRIDQQLKLRGFRIEPAEVEAELRRHPAVAQCAVVARTDASGEKNLVAYLVRHAGIEPIPDAEFRKSLLDLLPLKHVPQQWCCLEALPLTANGKLDHRALPDPAAGAPSRSEHVPPQNSVQAHLVEIWEEVLQRKPIGIHDDFFALGGHSLLVARVIALTLDRLGHRLPFAEFFARPTIERMALLIKDGQQLSAANHSWVLLNENGAKAPFFFLHGDFNGGGFFSRSLARYSGGDRPFYAMHPAGLHGDPIPTTVEEMAALKLQDLRKIQPEGPYLLGGYCNGALVAFEMARHIEAEGGKAPVVVMLYGVGSNAQLRHLQRALDVVSALRFEDPASRRRRFLRWRETYRFLQGVRVHYTRAAGDLIKHPPAEQARRIRNKMERVFARLFGKKAAAKLPLAENPDCSCRAATPANIKGDTYIEAVLGYVPKRFGGRIILLWPRDEKQVPLHGPTQGWKEVCDDVRLVLVPGEHDSCVERDSNLRVVGEQIGRALAELEG